MAAEPIAAAGCVFLYFNLPLESILVLPVWGVIGLLFYFLYGYRKSHVGLGRVEVHEDDPDAPHGSVAPLPGIPAPGDADE